jgi:hypothetical protein
MRVTRPNVRPADARERARLTPGDAPTRAAVAALQSGDPGRLRIPEAGGS